MRIALITTTILVSVFLGFLSTANGQGIYFEPAPTDVTAPVRLYVDVTSPECNCPELFDAGPDNPLYIWAWNPNEARAPLPGNIDITNGAWTNSNENLILTQDESNPNLWYFDFLGVSMVEFYGQPAAVFYQNGIDFLFKEKSGAANPDGAEQKSPDLNLIPEPPGCFEKICPFPTTFFQDEYFVITYDNNQETNQALRDLGPDECLIWYRISVNGGPLTTVQEDSDKFKMDFEGDGFFSLKMIPEAYFELAEGDELSQVQVFITRPPIFAPPFTAPITLIPGCD
jgi:hypothetical protein